MFYFDPMYILIVMLPALILSGLAQFAVKSAYATWSKKSNSSNITGAQTGNLLMQRYGLRVALGEAPSIKEGDLTDHYDPGNQIVRLSSGVSRLPSIASMAIAAHEFGHVQQYAQGNILIYARTKLIPVAQFGSQFSYLMIIGGIMLNVFALSLLGLLVFGAATMFTVLTLPIEIDASRRALNMLEEAGLLRTDEDRRGAQAMLTAAALTYLAALLVALLNFAYYAMIVFGSRDRRRG